MKDYGGVIPAEAGIQFCVRDLDFRFRGNDEQKWLNFIHSQNNIENMKKY